MQSSDLRTLAQRERQIRAARQVRAETISGGLASFRAELTVRAGHMVERLRRAQGPIDAILALLAGSRSQRS